MKTKNIMTNAGWIIGCKLIKAVLTLAVTMVVARQIGPARYGIIQYAAGLVAFLLPVMSLGLDSILVHEIVVHPNQEGETLGSAIFFSMCSGLLCAVGVSIFAFLAHWDDRVKLMVCMIYSLMLVFQALELIRFWFHAKLMAKYTAIAMLFSYIVVSALQILLALFSRNLNLIAFSMVSDYLLISIFLLLLYHRMGEQKLSVSMRRGRDMLAESKHFILPAIMGVVYSKTDTIMISTMLGDEQTGFYSAAVTCANMTAFVFAAIMDSVRPVIFQKLDAKDEAGFENSLSMLYSVITYLSVAQSVLMTLFAGLVIRIMYGTAYMAAVPALQIVVWYTTFSYYGTIRNIWMLAEGKQKYLWKINLFGACANIVLNLFVIPPWGIVGAAVASLVTQIFTNVIVGFMLKPIRKNNTLMLRGLKPSTAKTVFGYIKKTIAKP